MNDGAKRHAITDNITADPSVVEEITCFRDTPRGLTHADDETRISAGEIPSARSGNVLMLSRNNIRHVHI